MNHIYLEVTFRGGKALAAYLYLPRRTGDSAVRTVKAEGGLIVDFSAYNRPIGIEITAPHQVNLLALNRILADLHQPLATSNDLAPLLAA
ncbi:MAG: DUF2283 domain-containing protein [Phycisphaerae bacterium]